MERTDLQTAWRSYVRRMRERFDDLVVDENSKICHREDQEVGDFASIIERVFPLALSSRALVPGDDLYEETLVWLDSGTFGRNSFVITDAIEAATQ